MRILSVRLCFQALFLQESENTLRKRKTVSGKTNSSPSRTTIQESRRVLDAVDMDGRYHKGGERRTVPASTATDHRDP